MVEARVTGGGPEKPKGNSRIRRVGMEINEEKDVRKKGKNSNKEDVHLEPK